MPTTSSSPGPVTLADLEADPHPVLARLRSQAPAVWVPALGSWLVTGYDAAVTVLRDARTFTVDDPRFSTAKVVGPSMLSLDGAPHSRHRGPFTRPFRHDDVHARLASVTRAEAGRLVAAIEPLGSAERRGTGAGPLAVAVMAQMLGLGHTDPAQVLAWYDGIVAAVQAEAGGASQSAAGPEPAASGGRTEFADLGLGHTDPAQVLAWYDGIVAAVQAEAGGASQSAAGPEPAASGGRTEFADLGLGHTDPAQVLAWYDGIVAAVQAEAGGASQSAAGPEPAASGGRTEFAELSAPLHEITAWAPGSRLAEVTGAPAEAQRAEARLAEAEAISNAAVLLFGGIETTEGMI